MLGFHCVGIQLWVVSCWQSENWSGEGVIGQLEVGFDMQSVYGRLSCGHILGNPGRLNRRGSTVWVELGYHPFCRQGRLAGNVPWGWRWCGQGVWSGSQVLRKVPNMKGSIPRLIASETFCFLAGRLSHTSLIFLRSCCQSALLMVDWNVYALLRVVTDEPLSKRTLKVDKE